MPTKNANQRRHYVLAENEQAAYPILDTLRKNGLKEENIHFLTSTRQIVGHHPTNLTFIYGPGWTKHPEGIRLAEWVTALVGLGAAVKPIPERRLIDQLDDDEKAAAETPIDPAVESLKKALAEAKHQAKLAELGMTGGLWDLLGRPVQKNAAGEYEEAPPPPPKHKQYYLGGPKNGQRRRLNTPARHESFELSLPRDMYFDDGSKAIEPLPRYTPVTYTAWPVSVLGEELTFWIYEHDWDDRQRLVREFLLSPLEI